MLRTFCGIHLEYFCAVDVINYVIMCYRLSSIDETNGRVFEIGGMFARVYSGMLVE